MRTIILIVAVAAMLSTTSCGTVSREQVEAWQARVEQAETYAQQAERIAQQAEALAERLGSEEAQRIASEARAVAAAAAAASADLKASPPQEGDPWWMVIVGIISAAAGAFGGYRSGLYHPIPKAKR